MTKDEALQVAFDSMKDHLVYECHEESITNGLDIAIEAIRTALAQPEPAECDGGQCGIGGYCKECPKPLAKHTPLYTAPPKKEWQDGYKAGYAQAQETDLAIPCTPKEWVGLTDEDIYAIQYTDRPFMFARALERVLKEKNNENK